MDFGVLGPLRVEGPDGAIEIRGAKERLLLARLLAARGRVIPTSDLIDSLWREEPPTSAAKSLQTFVLRLRNTLEPDREGSPRLLLTDGPGYRLAVDAGRVDAERFTRLARMGERALADARPERAIAAVSEALDLWRGPAYAGFESTPAIAAEARTLEELRITATEVRLAAQLALGEVSGAIPDLERMVLEHPLRERLWEMLMTALYRSGRQGEALGAFDRARAILAEELGVDPDAGLRAVHARVLAHDPALGRPNLRSALPPALQPPSRFVGREAELARLHGLWDDAIRGASRIVVVRGPRGSGGRALAATFAAEVVRDGATVHYLSSSIRDDGAAVTVPGAAVLVVADHTDAVLPATLTIRLTGRLGPVPAGADVLDLGPLSPQDTRQIVADYVAVDEVTSVTAEVLERSGGWPGAIHAAALEAARERAMRRVEVAAGALGSTGAELSRVRTELADGIEVLQGAQSALSAPDPGRCPWRGLEAYDVGDARWFAGRERLVAELVASLAASRVLALVGSSGSGKSSLLRAGLLAALGADALPGSSGWRVVALRPGEHPMRELAREALGQAGRESVGELLTHLVTAAVDDLSRVVVVIDQFEEVWTVCTDESERRQFLDSVSELATDARSNVSIVLAMRADFMGRLAEHEALRGLVRDGTVLVGPMTRAEVHRAVERPARAAGLVLDDGLVDTVVSDAGEEPGLLPLLSVTLAQLWEQRDERALTYAAYVRMGGLSGSIASLAEECWTAMTDSERDAARLVLMRLTGPGDGAGVTRRRVAISELESLSRPDVREAVEAMSRGRLLTVSDGTVEVAHEALFREWPRLRTWLVEDATGRAIQRRLAVAAAEWEAEGREPSALWSGTRLASGLEIAESRPEELTPVEHDFLRAGHDALDADRRATEERARQSTRQNRRLRRLVAGIALVLIVALVAGVAAWRAQQSAQAASLSAEAKGLAATALNIEYPDLALLAAVESTRIEQSPETYGALLTLLARQPAVAHRVRTENRFLRIAASPDGGFVVVTENHPFIRAIDADTGQTLWNVEMPQRGQAGQPTVTADGAGVIVPEFSDEPGLVRLDAETGEVDWELRGVDALVPGSVEEIDGGGMRSDGRYLAANGSHVLTIDAATGELLDAVPWPEAAPFTDFFLVWPDGRVSRADEDEATGEVFDLRRPELGSVQVAGIPTSVSPDGSRLVMVHHDDTGSNVEIVPTGDVEAQTPTVRVESYVRGAPWSSDGTLVALTAERGIQVLDVATMRLGRTAVAHSGSVLDARFAGLDGRMVWTAGRDGTSVGFDLSGRTTPIATSTVGLSPSLGASSHSAQRGAHIKLVFTGTPHLAYVTDLRTGSNLGELLPDIGGPGGAWPPDTGFEPGSVAITPDGDVAVVGVNAYTPALAYLEDRGAVVLFDAATQHQLSVIEVPWMVHSVAVTPDGRHAVVNGRGGFAVIDLADATLTYGPTELEESEGIDGTTATAVSPDGRFAALARNDEIVLISMEDGHVVRRAAVASDDDQFVQALAWSNDSRTLVAGADDGRLHVVSAATLEPVAPSRLITGGWVIDLETAPDGRTLASMGSDGDIILWDTSTWRPYGQPVTDDRTWGWLTFSEDGRSLRAFFEEGDLVQVSVDPSDWVAAACAAAGRNLTAEEAAVIVPDRPLQPSCPEE
ncbi:nSTAND1 domain-containing NTPase [Agromyces sp. M3QZ16-3]|uniref:nSTAND1 domain-containing NTPase n=1 Tax=Agromyces sp. M3QZ16-3 TaxID=3447585 RepID=UPI003F68D44A